MQHTQQKREKRQLHVRKCQENSRANQILSKMYVSYTPVINFASSISNTYNSTKPLHNELYNTDILNLNKIWLQKLGKLLIMNCKIEISTPISTNTFTFIVFPPTYYQCLIMV
jgi:uncharacterized Rmd1/YagE family protein